MGAQWIIGNKKTPVHELCSKLEIVDKSKVWQSKILEQKSNLIGAIKGKLFLQIISDYMNL
jgi:hypothetical protein